MGFCLLFRLFLGVRSYQIYFRLHLKTFNADSASKRRLHLKTSASKRQPPPLRLPSPVNNIKNVHEADCTCALVTQNPNHDTHCLELK